MRGRYRGIKQAYKKGFRIVQYWRLHFADADLFLVVDDGFTITRIDDSSSEDGATFIGGIQWDFSSVSLRLEYEWWDVDDADATLLGVGLHWRF